MTKKNPKNLGEVREVLQRNKRDLIEKFRAHGVAIGKRNLRDDAYVITVFMETSGDIPTEPAEVEGIPLKFEVTGKFEAQE